MAKKKGSADRISNHPTTHISDDESDEQQPDQYIGLTDYGYGGSSASGVNIFPPAMPPAMAPAMPPAMSQPMVSPGASAPLSPIPVEQVNTKLMGIPRAISGGKSKRKSFISKSRTIKANRKHK